MIDFIWDWSNSCDTIRLFAYIHWFNLIYIVILSSIGACFGWRPKTPSFPGSPFDWRVGASTQRSRGWNVDGWWMGRKVNLGRVHINHCICIIRLMMYWYNWLMGSILDPPAPSMVDCAIYSLHHCQLIKQPAGLGVAGRFLTFIRKENETPLREAWTGHAKGQKVIRIFVWGSKGKICSSTTPVFPRATNCLRRCIWAKGAPCTSKHIKHDRIHQDFGIFGICDVYIRIRYAF